MNCDGIRQELTALLDLELPAAQRGAVELHLTTCAGCAAELRSLKRTRELAIRVMAQVAAPLASRSSFEQFWDRATASGVLSPAHDMLEHGHDRRDTGASPMGPASRRAWMRWRGGATGWTAVGGMLAAGLAIFVYMAGGMGSLNQPSRSLDLAGGRSRLISPAEQRAAAAPRDRHQPHTPTEPAQATDNSEEIETAAAQELSDRDLRAPDELRARPGLFLDFAIVRRLEKLRKLESALGEPQPAPNGTTSDEQRSS